VVRRRGLKRDDHECRRDAMTSRGPWGYVQGLHGVEGLHPDKTLARRFRACRSPVRRLLRGGGDPSFPGPAILPHFPKNVIAQPAILS